MVAVPYVQKTSHNLEGSQKVLFSAPTKMVQICSKLRSIAEDLKKAKCQKRHGHPYVLCWTGVVYRIPLTCGRSYVGQTGGCLNDGLLEPDCSLKSTVSGHLPVHSNTCFCSPTLHGTTILDIIATRLLTKFWKRIALIFWGTAALVIHQSHCLNPKPCF